MRISPLFLVAALGAGFALACAGGKHEGNKSGECSDGADNDDDGLFDCDDDDCDGSSDCGAEDTGSGPIATCDDGNFPSGVTFVDDHGDTVDPYSWCGNVVLVSFGAMWEGGSQAETGDLQSLYDELHGSGFIAVQALIENVDSQTPSSAELTEWEQTYDVSFPVVADPNSEGLYSFASGSIGLPYRVLVNREMQVTDSDGGVSDADARALVAE